MLGNLLWLDCVVACFFGVFLYLCVRFRGAWWGWAWLCSWPDTHICSALSIITTFSYTQIFVKCLNVQSPVPQSSQLLYHSTFQPPAPLPPHSTLTAWASYLRNSESPPAPPRESPDWTQAHHLYLPANPWLSINVPFQKYSLFGVRVWVHQF